MATLFTFFSNTTHKTKVGTPIGRRLLIATHLDQSNYLGSDRQGAVNENDLTPFSRVGLAGCTFF